MSTNISRIKVRHAEKVLASLDKLRAWEWICDFTIEVEDESFPVHRAVLASSSEYFFNLFKQNGEEVRKGGVCVTGLDASIVKLCIEFMYSGVADVTLENVDNVLLAASNFKLTDLTELCLDLLKSELSVQNCLFVKSVYEKYGYIEESDDVEKFITDNFDQLVSTKEFLDLKKDDISNYLKSPNVDYVSLWKAITTWVKFRETERKKYYFEFLSLNSVKLPPEFLLETVWPDRLTKESRQCKSLIVSVLLADLKKLESGISIRNCFLVKQLCESCHHTNSGEAQNLVQIFMMKSFEKIADSEEITTLSKDEIFRIFQSSKTKYRSEITKWEVAVKWTKHDLPIRKRFFKDLLSAIKFENLPLNFVEEVIRPESLVQESAKCKELLMDALFVLAHQKTSAKTPPWKKSIKESSTPKVAKVHKMSESTLEAPPQKVQKIPKSAGKTKENGPSDTLSEVSSSNITYLAVYNPDSGKVKGLNLDKIEWKDIAITKITKDEFQGMTCVGNKLYLLKGTCLFVLEKTRWNRLASKPSKPQSEAKMVKYQNSLFIIEDGCISSYDVEAGEWNVQEQFMLTGNEFCACATDMYIFVLGGSRFPTVARKYDPLSGEISEIEPLSTPRIGASAATLKGNVYIMGGISDAAPNAMVERYETRLDLWSVVPNMQVRRSNFAACADDGKIYAVGGSRAQTADKMDTVEVYELVKDRYKWRILHRTPKLNSQISACIAEMPYD